MSAFAGMTARGAGVQTSRTDRIATLDGLRGAAVMGILLMNIVAFAMPEAAYFNPEAYGSPRPIDRWVWALNVVLVDGKMRGLFSLLFGASMLLVIGRAEATGENGARVHFRRMAWLLVFGLAHFYLIWWGDILFHYAVVGMVALAFAWHEPKALLRWGALFFLIQMLISAMLFAALASVRHEAGLPGADASALAAWQEIEEGFGRPGIRAIAQDLAIHRGGYADVLRYRLSELATNPLFYLLAGGAETLGLMLFGMAGLKSGFLTGAWPRARYARTALIAYALGVPPMALLTLGAIGSGYDALAIVGLMFAATPLRPVIMLGHAALLLYWLTGRASALKDRTAAAGRMAFSNYLGTSIVMTTIFYGYGFSLYGDISRAELYLIVLAGWALMLGWSKPWLGRFRYGPLEWLWRSLARGSPQPMRRQRI